MGLGSWKGRTIWPLPWLQSQKSLTILGIKFYQNFTETIQENTQILQIKINQYITQNTNRALTVLQRSQFCNVFILSRLIYTATILPLAENKILKWQRILWKFIFTNRLEKLKMEETYSKIKFGGLSFKHLFSQCQAVFISTFLKQFIAQPPTSNTKILNYWHGIELRHILPSIKTQHADLNETHVTITPILDRIKHIYSTTPLNNKTITSKFLYQMIAEFYTMPPKILTKFPLTNSKHSFKNIDSPFLRPQAKEHIFLMRHDILTTKERLLKCRQIESAKCHYCNNTETLLHIPNCPVSQPSIKWLLRVLSKMDDNFNILPTINILSLNFKLKNKKKHKTAIYITSEFLLALWKSRKKKLQNILSYVHSNVKYHWHLLLRNSRNPNFYFQEVLK